jgi:hypothetical protein
MDEPIRDGEPPISKTHSSLSQRSICLISIKLITYSMEQMLVIIGIKLFHFWDYTLYATLYIRSDKT